MWKKEVLIISAAQPTMPPRQWEFQLSSVADLKRLSQRLGVSVDATEDVSILAQPVDLGGLVIPNSLAVHPMEGCDGDAQGRPDRLTVRRYERFAAGGAGLIWAEAIAIIHEARANPRQLWLHQGTKDAFAALVKRAREKAAEANGAGHRPVMVAQLTHSGRYSKPGPVPCPIIPERDPYRDPMTPQPKPTRIERARSRTTGPSSRMSILTSSRTPTSQAARIAFEVGFDAVDIKACHGYLINELLACHNRPGKYGGSFENRTRFMLDVIDRIRAELGDKARIVTRMGIYDAIPYPYGWGVDKDDYTKPDLTEPKKLIGLLRQRGVKLINITIANPYYNPHVGRPFNEPIVGGYGEPEHPLAGVARLVKVTGEIQKEFPDMAFVGTGYSWLRTLFANVGAANKTNGLVTLVGRRPHGIRLSRLRSRHRQTRQDVPGEGLRRLQRLHADHAGQRQDRLRRAGQRGLRADLRARPDERQRQPAAIWPLPAGNARSRRASLAVRPGSRFRSSSVCSSTARSARPTRSSARPTCFRRSVRGCARSSSNARATACRASSAMGSLPIANIQRYLAEQANKNGWSKLRVPEKATGKRVAVIGAGPAGLACAAKLLEAGHTVTLFNKSAAFGGMVESVIPPDRQRTALKNEITAMFADVPKDRMILNLGKELGSAHNLDTILAQGFDAAFIGLGLPKSTSIAEKPLDGLWNAMDFLSAAKRGDESEPRRQVRRRHRRRQHRD